MEHMDLFRRHSIRPMVNVPIRGLVTDFAGVAAYMDIGALQRILHEGDTVNGAYLAVDQKYWSAFMREVKDIVGFVR